MLLQVHDELVLETKSADAEAVAHQVAVKMESAAHLRVPLRVNTAVGANWQAAH
jgi:DNA polymerase-1